MHLQGGVNLRRPFLLKKGLFLRLNMCKKGPYMLRYFPCQMSMKPAQAGIFRH